MTEHTTTANDPVNHPSHYTTGKIECIDFILDKKLNFCRGNAIKYIVRAGLKDPTKEVEDLEKAIFYLMREIDTLRRSSSQPPAPSPEEVQAADSTENVDSLTDPNASTHEIVF